MKRTAEEMVNEIMAKVKKIESPCMFDRIETYDTESNKNEVKEILTSIYNMYKRHNDNLGMVQVEIAMSSIL